LLPPIRAKTFQTFRRAKIHRQENYPRSLVGFFFGERENPFSLSKEKGFSQKFFIKLLTG